MQILIRTLLRLCTRREERRVHYRGAVHKQRSNDVQRLSRVRIIATLVGLVSFSAQSWAQIHVPLPSLQPPIIRACEDEREWPPFTYYERNSNHIPTHKVVGVSVDVVSSILNKYGTKLEVDLIPGSKCKSELKKGQLYQLELNASYSPTRSKEYLLSDTVYQATSVSFYYEPYHPDGIKITSLLDLKNYKICGIVGYNYSSYDLADNSRNLNLGSYNFPQVLAKLKNKSCDIFIEKLEVVLGQQRIGKGFLENPDLKWEKIPDKQDETFHIMVTKKSPYSKQLLAILNQGIKEMKDNGDLKKILDKYSL